MREPYPQFNVRLPDELRDLIKAAAETNGRSQTAEVIARLEDSFMRDGSLPPSGPLRSPSPDDVSTRELIVAMEILTNQVSLMRDELSDRLSILTRQGESASDKKA